MTNFASMIKEHNKNILCKSNMKIMQLQSQSVFFIRCQTELSNFVLGNVNSNHPPHTIKNLLESISQHIKLSSGKTIFNNSKQLFKNTLSTCGFGYKIMLQPLTENKDHSHNKKWGQKMVWFNPPSSCTVATSTGKKFLSLWVTFPCQTLPI